MTLTAGTLSIVNVTSVSDSLAATAATGGTGPYTQQWYRSTTTGFTPGGGNILTGATALTLNDSNLIPNTTYYYVVVYTDTGHSNDTVSSAQLTVSTLAPSQSPNQFNQAPFLGMLDLKVGPQNVVAAQIDVTQSTPLFAGSPVKVVNNSNGIPTVVAISANTDNVFGFIVYDIKSQSFPAGARCEVALAGSCMFLYATTAITRATQVVPDISASGAIQAPTSTDTFVGWAYDQATAYGQLIRVVLTTPSFLHN